MIGHFVRDCIVGGMDPVDYNTSPLGGKMQVTVTADFPVYHGVLKLLFKGLINQTAAKKTYKIRQKQDLKKQQLWLPLLQ